MTSENLRLRLEPRELTGKSVKKLRRQGIVPVGVFGKGVEPFNAQVSEREFLRVVRGVGRSSLFQIEIEGRAPQRVFIQEVQRHPVTRQIMHADLYVVDLTSEVTHDVPVVMIGENPLIERGDAVANLALHVLHLRALPTELPHEVQVDVSQLTDFGQAIHVRDLDLGDKVQVLTPGDETVLSLTHTRMAVEEETTGGPETAEPQLVREEKREE